MAVGSGGDEFSWAGSVALRYKVTPELYSCGCVSHNLCVLECRDTFVLGDTAPPGRRGVRHRYRSVRATHTTQRARRARTAVSQSLLAWCRPAGQPSCVRRAAPGRGGRARVAWAVQTGLCAPAWASVLYHNKSAKPPVPSQSLVARAHTPLCSHAWRARLRTSSAKPLSVGGCACGCTRYAIPCLDVRAGSC